MAQHIPYTLNYSGRQVDIELLQSVSRPVDLQAVTLGNVNQTPKLVTGIQKLVQRYTSILLSIVNTVKFDASNGTTLVSSIAGGLVQNTGKLQNVFASANLATIGRLRLDDAKTDIYGTVPDDERIANASLLNSNVNFTTNTIYMRILITTQAGDSLEFIVPTTAPR